MSMDYLTGYDCGAPGCFDDKFKTCSAAKRYTQVMGIGLLAEIIAPKDGACEVKITMPKGFMDQLADNTSMTCVFDNTKPYEQAFSEALSANKCEGDLMMLFSGQAMMGGSDSTVEEVSDSTDLSAATSGEYADAQRYWHMVNMYEALNYACNDHDTLDLSENTSALPVVCNVKGSYGPFFGIKFSKIKDPALQTWFVPIMNQLAVQPVRPRVIILFLIKIWLAVMVIL